MKATWRVLLGLLLVAAPLAVQAQLGYATNADGSIYKYSTNADGSITIAAYAGPPWAVTIPTNINGLLVTSIGQDAFSDSGLTSVTIPDSVASIGDSAFSFCSRLTSVNIPGNVTSIGEYAFYYSGLATLTISNGLTTIGPLAFADCTSLTTVTIPGSVTNIGDSAFSDSGLYTLTIGNGLTSIGPDAFADCTSLTTVTIPGSVTNIGDGAFYDGPNLARIYFVGDAPAIGLNVFSSDCYNATVYYLPGTTGWASAFGGLPTARTIDLYDKRQWHYDHQLHRTWRSLEHSGHDQWPAGHQHWR